MEAEACCREESFGKQQFLDIENDCNTDFFFKKSLYHVATVNFSVCYMVFPKKDHLHPTYL